MSSLVQRLGLGGLLQRLHQLRGELEQQQQRAEAAEAAAEAVERGAAALDAQAARVQRFQVGASLRCAELCSFLLCSAIVNGLLRH